MSSNLPASNPHAISYLIPGVRQALQNKTNLTDADIAAWIKKTLLNLTETYPFEELRVIGPVVTIGPQAGINGSNYMYPVSMFLNSGDDYTLFQNPVIFLSPTQATQAGLVGAGTGTGGVIGYPMKYMAPVAIQTIIFVTGGIPSRFTRYGPNFWFGPQPGQNYQAYLPYQVRHPFNDTNLPQSPLYIPTSWEDVVEYSAALRGAHANRWPEMVKDLRYILYGDPKNPGEPGLLKALVPQNQRDASNSTRQLIPVVSRY